jgi:hypothetical protein
MVPFSNVKFLGDDSNKSFEPGVPMTTADLISYTETVSTAADRCGFVINPFKTVVRTAYFEYLKVIGIYGHLVPQLGRLMPFSSERNNSLLDPIEGMRGLCSFYRTVIARGGNHEFCLRFMTHLWNIRRGVKVGYSTRSNGVVKQFEGDRFADYHFACLWLPQALGGVGELPFTLVGASKDAMCYLYARKFGYLEALDDAAHLLDYGKDDSARMLAKQIERSGQTDKFKLFIQTRMQSGEKFKNAERERKEMPIDIGDYEYTDLARRRIIRTLTNSSKITKLTIDSKRAKAKAMLTRKLSLRQTSYMQVMFGWLDHFDFSYGFEIADLCSANATVGRSEDLARLERKIGFSTTGNDQRKRITALFARMRDNRFNPDAEFGFDALVQLFTRPDIFPDVEKLTSVAIRIGADPLRAAAFASSFVTSLDSVLLVDKGQKFSSGDEFSSNLDLSYSRLAQLIDVPIWILDSNIQYLVRQVAAMMMLTTPPQWPLRSIVVRTFGNAEGDAIQLLQPTFPSKINQYVRALGLYADALVP